MKQKGCFAFCPIAANHRILSRKLHWTQKYALNLWISIRIELQKGNSTCIYIVMYVCMYKYLFKFIVSIQLCMSYTKICAILNRVNCIKNCKKMHIYIYQKNVIQLWKKASGMSIVCDRKMYREREKNGQNVYINIQFLFTLISIESVTMYFYFWNCELFKTSSSISFAICFFCCFSHKNCQTVWIIILSFITLFTHISILLVVQFNFCWNKPIFAKYFCFNKVTRFHSFWNKSNGKFDSFQFIASFCRKGDAKQNKLLAWTY